MSIFHIFITNLVSTTATRGRKVSTARQVCQVERCILCTFPLSGGERHVSSLTSSVQATPGRKLYVWAAGGQSPASADHC